MSGPISNALASRRAAVVLHLHRSLLPEHTHKAINTTTTTGPGNRTVDLPTITISSLPQSSPNPHLRGEKIDTLVNFMARDGITIAAIQETHIGPNTSLKPPSGYSIIRTDRPKEKRKGSSRASYYTSQSSTGCVIYQYPQEINA